MNFKERVLSLKDSVQKMWGESSPARRYLIVAAGAAAFALILWAAYAAKGSGYVTLYTGDYSAVGEVTRALDAEKIPYKLDQSGQRVLVPADKLPLARVETLGRGVPRQGSAGYELLDKSQVSLTESDRSLQHKRILEGELARTVSSLAGVESARVHIALPENSPFIREKTSPTASVVVSTKPGIELSPADVRAIANVVAAAVPNLEPQKVVVTDSRGKILRWDDFSVESEDLSRRIEQSVLNVLNAAFGPGAVVSVRVETDPTSEVITEEKADAPLVRSRQQESESYQGSGPVPGGVPGANSNIPGYFTPAPGDGSGQYSRQKTIENFEFPVTRRQITKPAGTVKEISVAAVVPAVLSPEEEARVIKLVAAAAGVQTESVVVAGIPPREPPQEEVIPWWKDRRIIELAAALLAVVVAAVAIAVVLLKRRRTPASVPGTVLEVVPSRSTAELVSDTIRRNPIAAANAIRAFMRERGDER